MPRQHGNNTEKTRLCTCDKYCNGSKLVIRKTYGRHAEQREKEQLERIQRALLQIGEQATTSAATTLRTHRKRKRQIITSPTNHSDTTANIPQAVDVDSDSDTVNMDNIVDAEDVVMQHNNLPSGHNSDNDHQPGLDHVNSNVLEAEDVWNYGDLPPPSSPSSDDDADVFNTNLTEDDLDAPLPHCQVPSRPSSNPAVPVPVPVTSIPACSRKPAPHAYCTMLHPRALHAL
ncbi:hypothetical protein M378DRAFT_6956 [Amanita muscaria Koide BX008]|uniref:Uncharacterized protein n=1 Tax=Amanita muscaria (strain Koide BX008) TaxID=946122 RepID=A0A0C2XKK5_AMAMK|nr:hypothetical protein M378DRAFT_6956 [Amanita muscaria Koide BX008]